MVVPLKDSASDRQEKNTKWPNKKTSYEEPTDSLEARRSPEPPKVDLPLAHFAIALTAALFIVGAGLVYLSSYSMGQLSQSFKTGIALPTRNPIDRPSQSFQTTNSKSIAGPVIPLNFPDPSILYLDNITYAFATNNRLKHPDSLIHIQVATSHDNLTWALDPTYDALPQVGAWARPIGVWAPDVVRLSDGKFVLYYAAPTREKQGTHCISAAFSPPTAPLGPYVPLPNPLACPIELGGAIDVDGFLDPVTGKRYITYKVDGNNIGHGGSCNNDIPPIVPTPIMLQEVSELDGTTLIGDPIELLNRLEGLDGPLIEAPSLRYVPPTTGDTSDGGTYFLFYSSNCFTSRHYDIKYATATHVSGPYSRSPDPLLKTGDGNKHVRLLGPGGMDVLNYENTVGTIHEDGDEADEAMVLFHGILTEDQMPADYVVGGGRHGKGGKLDVPERPTGVIRGMYQGKLKFEGKKARFI